MPSPAIEKHDPRPVDHGAHPEKIRLKVKRQNGAGGESYWQTFEFPNWDKANVISALMELRKNPVTDSGEETSPPAWEAVAATRVSKQFTVHGAAAMQPPPCMLCRQCA